MDFYTFNIITFAVLMTLNTITVFYVIKHMKKDEMLRNIIHRTDKKNLELKEINKTLTKDNDDLKKKLKDKKETKKRVSKK